MEHSIVTLVKEIDQVETPTEQACTSGFGRARIIYKDGTVATINQGIDPMLLAAIVTLFGWKAPSHITLRCKNGRTVGAENMLMDRLCQHYGTTYALFYDQEDTGTQIEFCGSDTCGLPEPATTTPTAHYARITFPNHSTIENMGFGEPLYAPLNTTLQLLPDQLALVSAEGELPKERLYDDVSLHSGRSYAVGSRKQYQVEMLNIRIEYY